MKTEIKHGKLVGRIDNKYYFCDTIFDYHCGLKGAVATVLCPVSLAVYEERTDPESEVAADWFEDLWRKRVKAGQTTQSLKEHVKEVLAVNGDEAVFDMSGYDYWDALREAVPELTEENYPVFECVGGGRSFSKDMKFDEIYDKKLWQQIKEIEI